MGERTGRECEGVGVRGKRQERNLAYYTSPSFCLGLEMLRVQIDRITKDSRSISNCPYKRLDCSTGITGPEFGEGVAKK